jgi:chemotaxis protein methyltransferase CheR
MKDSECVEFLRWCLPRLGLEGHAGEWRALDQLCRITISRFYRDRGVFDAIRTQVLPGLAQGAIKSCEDEIRCWSAGCGSGEEPYTLEIIWKLAVLPPPGRDIRLRIVATDTDRALLERARKGLYPQSSLKDLPEEMRGRAFVRSGDSYAIGDAFGEDIEFVRQDVREQVPEGAFHLILCRNLVFTYFGEGMQREVLGRLAKKLLPGGFFITGIHEKLPDGFAGLVPCCGAPGIFQKEHPP